MTDAIPPDAAVEATAADNSSNAPVDATAPTGATAATPSSGLTPATPMSKNQQKKLKRQQQWEDARDDRKRKRKEKRQVKLAVKRAQKAEASNEAAAGDEVSSTPPKQHILVPVSLVFDCDFESLMTESELISLSGQLTRSYAAARAAAHTTRIYVSSWVPGSKMRTRYETLLTNQHTRWKNVFFLEDDFQEAGRQASTAMRGEGGGEVVASLQEAEKSPETVHEDEVDCQQDLVYLTSDSPHTLTHLSPYTSYVIGGIVDKNREKGLCYRRATERRVRTAKLPIGEYMVMASRQVLTTNQVVEIMLAWLATGDWATAFAKVIPKRKGGQLRGAGGGSEQGEQAVSEKDGSEAVREGVDEKDASDKDEGEDIEQDKENTTAEQVETAS